MNGASSSGVLLLIFFFFRCYIFCQSYFAVVMLINYSAYYCVTGQKFRLVPPPSLRHLNVITCSGFWGTKTGTSIYDTASTTEGVTDLMIT